MLESSKNKITFIVRRKDINEAVKRARDDEFNKCEREKEKALENLRKEIEGDYYLEMVFLKGKVHSLELKNVSLEKEIEFMKARDKEVKAIHLVQKQAASDLSFFAKKWQVEQTEKLQEILAIEQRLENIDKDVGVKQITNGGSN